jgi:hypothetical protein
MGNRNSYASLYPEDSATHTIDLLFSEKTRWFYSTAVNFITFYDGQVDTDRVRAKLIEIIRSNLWLTSRLCKGGKHKDIHLQFPAIFDEATLSQYFSEAVIDNSNSDFNLDDKSSIDDIYSQVNKYFVKTGPECLNKTPEVLFRVAMVKIINNSNNLTIKKTAFLVSLSHILGDGHTIYEIYSMFDYQIPVRSLIYQRKMEFQEQMQKVYSKELLSYFRSAFVKISFLKNRIYYYLTNKQMKIFSFQVDKNQIKQLKGGLLSPPCSPRTPEQEDPNLPFLSTNDILTSWFFRKLKCDYGLMAINYRNRWEGFTNDHAGNYEHFLFYGSGDFQSPQQIRQSLSVLHSENQQIPSSYETWKFHFGVVSNWSSFYREVLLQEDCPLLCHRPLIARDAIAMQGVLIVYCPRMGETGLYLLSHVKNDSEDHWKEDSPFVN